MAVCDVTQTGEVTSRPSPSRTKSITLASHEFFFRRYHSESVSLGSLIKARWKKRFKKRLSAFSCLSVFEDVSPHANWFSMERFQWTFIFGICARRYPNSSFDKVFSGWKSSQMFDWRMHRSFEDHVSFPWWRRSKWSSKLLYTRPFNHLTWLLARELLGATSPLCSMN